MNNPNRTPHDVAWLAISILGVVLAALVVLPYGALALYLLEWDRELTAPIVLASATLLNLSIAVYGLVWIRRGSRSAPPPAFASPEEADEPDDAGHSERDRGRFPLRIAHALFRRRPISKRGASATIVALLISIAALALVIGVLLTGLGGAGA